MQLLKTVLAFMHFCCYFMMIFKIGWSHFNLCWSSSEYGPLEFKMPRICTHHPPLFFFVSYPFIHTHPPPFLLHTVTQTVDACSRAVVYTVSMANVTSIFAGSGERAGWSSYWTTKIIRPLEFSSVMRIG